jgi:hypothetical protein
MGWLAVIGLPLLLLSQLTAGQDAVIRAATRYVPGVTWRAKSVVTGDFTCGGRKQTAILGTSAPEIIVAVFLNGTNKRPEVDGEIDPAHMYWDHESLHFSGGVTESPRPELR